MFMCSYVQYNYMRALFTWFRSILRNFLSHFEPFWGIRSHFDQHTSNKQWKDKWKTWPQMTPNDRTQTWCVIVRARVYINSTSDVYTTFIHFYPFYPFYPCLPTLKSIRFTKLPHSWKMVDLTRLIYHLIVLLIYHLIV